MTTRRLILAAPLALLVGFVAGGADAQTDPRGAAGFVRGVIDEGLSVIADNGAADADRRARLGSLVARSFDIGAGSRAGWTPRRQPIFARCISTM